jgi:hypothetical protein
MARKTTSRTVGVSRLQRAADAVKRLFGRGTRAEGTAEPQGRAAASAPGTTNSGNAPATGRVTRRETDIPMDVIGRSYNPQFTSSKAGFRSDGTDHHNDQEHGRGISDERWNDEDRLTNKSGDPRIGTHRRTYEPGETRAESRD